MSASHFVPFLEVCDIQGGTQPPKSTFVDEPTDGYVRLLQIQDFKTDKKVVYIPDKKTLKKCKSDDVLIARYGASLGKILSGLEGAYNVALVKTIPDLERIDRAYLAHFLRADAFQSFILNLGGRAAQAGFNKADLERIEIPLPPLEEQKRIAGILDQADALRRLRSRALDKLNTLGQAIFHEMFGDPDRNQFGFEACKLSEIIKIVGGSQPAKKHFLYEDGPDRVRFIQTRDFRTDEYKTYVPRELAKRPFAEEDVIIGRYGPPVFQIFRGLSGTYNVALMKAEPLGEITKDFVYYLLKEPRLHAYVVANSERTAGQSGVNLALLNDYPVIAPPMDLQVEFSRRLGVVGEMLKSQRQSLVQLEKAFASLQHRAFRGEL